MSRDPIAFLDAVAGYAAERNNGGSADRAIKLAVIDPAYVASTFPATLPKVTFYGESTLSGKRYPVMSGYLPRPSDKVIMLPAGNTYVILGSLDADTVGFHGDGYYQSDAFMWEDYNNTNDTFTGTSYAAQTQCGTDFVAPQSGAVIIEITGLIGQNGATLGQSAHLSFEVRTGSTVGSGSVILSASDSRAIVYFQTATVAGFKYLGGAFRHPLTGLTPGSAYNVRFMSKTQNNTGAHVNRHITVEQVPGGLG